MKKRPADVTSVLPHLSALAGEIANLRDRERELLTRIAALETELQGVTMPSDKWLTTHRQVKFYLPIAEHEALKAECAKRGITVATALRSGLNAYLNATVPRPAPTMPVTARKRTKP